MYEGRTYTKFTSDSSENTGSAHGSSEVSINFYETTERNSYFPHIRQTKIIMSNTDVNQSILQKMV